jgi:hypothetical protein
MNQGVSAAHPSTPPSACPSGWTPPRSGRRVHRHTAARTAARRQLPHAPEFRQTHRLTRSESAAGNPSARGTSWRHSDSASP